MGFLDFLKKKKKKIVVNFNASDLSEGEKFQALLNEVAYLRGILARQSAEEAKKRESKKDIDEEREKANELKEQAKLLRKKDIRPFSLFSVLKHQKNRRIKRKIHFTTFDGEKDLGIVEDFVIMPEGSFGVVSGGKVIWASQDLERVFYWVNGLSNYAKNKIIPLCINSSNQYEPNPMVEQIAQVVRTSEGKFRINRFNKRPFYEELADKEENINELNNELESSEATIAEQQKEINEKIREANLHRVRADKAESDLSMALHKVAEIEMANGMIIKQNMALTSVKEINEELIKSYEEVIKELGEKIEKMMGKGAERNVWLDLKEKVEWAKENIPQTIYQLPEKEEKPSLTEGVRPVKP